MKSDRKVNGRIHSKYDSTKEKLQVHDFIGLVNYYRDMWDIGSHLLHPLTTLTSDKIMFKWTYVEKKLFDGIKRVFDHDTLLVYPYFNKCVDTHVF